MLRLLLNRYHGGNFESLLAALPDAERQKIINVSLESKEPEAYLLQPYENLRRIHYSWFIEPLRRLDKKKLPLALSLFDEEQNHKLRKYLHDKSSPLSLSKSMKRFVFQQMHEAFLLEDVLPITYLPRSEMTELAEIRKEELIELIDFLGLYDLAGEIHHIVNRRLLEKIYAFLNKKKLNFLKKCMRQKEKLVTQRIKLENWDGNRIKLQKLLHHKGIIRLGYALSGEKRELIWHIAHILDTGRGEKLSRYCAKDPIAGVTEALKKQVMSILTYFKQTSET